MQITLAWSTLVEASSISSLMFSALAVAADPLPEPPCWVCFTAELYLRAKSIPITRWGSHLITYMRWTISTSGHTAQCHHAYLSYLMLAITTAITKILPGSWLSLVGWRLPVVDRLNHSQINSTTHRNGCSAPVVHWRPQLSGTWQYTLLWGVDGMMVNKNYLALAESISSTILVNCFRPLWIEAMSFWKYAHQ